MTTWDPEQYLRFEAPRLRPALDLVARLEHAGPGVVVDLGCGTGHITALLAHRWPGAEVTGVDSSPAMLEGARRDHPDLTWVEGDIARWSAPRPVDVLFSNAALHWVPDHERLFPALFDQVAPGGLLAVQVPGMWEAPSHTIAFDLARQPEWRDRLDGAMRDRPLLAPERYLEVLEPLAEDVSVWTTTYYHVLEGPHAVTEWFEGSLLRAFLSRLDEDEGRRFVDLYTEQVDAAYPPRADGRTVLPFRRLFVLARRSA